MFERLVDDGIPVCVAGSGPSLLAFEDEEHRVADPGEGWTVLRPTVPMEGATLEVVSGG
jgi:hypothetical protein